MIKKKIAEDALIVFSPGFEDRSKAFLDRYNIENANVLGLLISDFYNPKINELNRLTSDFVQSREIKDYKMLEMSYRSPVINFDILKQFDFSQYSKIYIDITTFTDELLLVLFKVLQTMEINCVNLIYVTPSEYFYERKSQLSLSYRIKEIRNILGYPGMFYPLRKNHLIIIVGFEYDRVSYLINQLQYSKITLLYPTKNGSYSIDNYKISNEIMDKLESTDQNIISSRIAINNLDDCYNDLLKQVQEVVSNNENVTIAPLSNKISTLATYKISQTFNDLQILYTTVEDYDIDYSKGYKDFIELNNFKIITK